MLGTTVGTYRVTGSIGRGGMGAVYAAEHTLLGRPAAVKVLLPEFSQNQEIVTRFFNEARAATAIRHPSIVEIYDFGWSPDGSAYIVMEYLQGESLAARLGRGRMGEGRALAVARQTAGALAAAHAKGIVHRDLKPDNIFIVPDPEVPGGERIKLLDFGIAKLAVDSAGGHQKTRTGAVIGTPTYMAPEQCRGVAVDHRADLYSLGCILFEALTGRPPFVGEGVGDILAAHIHVPPPAIAPMAPGVAPAAEQLCQRLLVKDPAQRVQSAEELIHAIDAATGGITYRSAPRAGDGQAVAVAPVPTTLSGAAGVQTGGGGMGTVPAPRGGKTGLWIGIGAAVVVLGVVLAVLLAGGEEDGAKEGGAGGTVAAGPTAPVVATPTPTSPTPTPTPIPDPIPTPNPTANPDPTPTAIPKPTANPTQTGPTPTNPTPASPAPSPVEAPSTVSFTLQSTPQGATVMRGRDMLGKTPFRGELPRGSEAVSFTLRLPGYKDKVVKVTSARDVELEVALVKKRAPATDTLPTERHDRGVNPFDY